MQRLKIKRTILRVAMTLVVMLLTSATAWAQTTETLGGYEFTIETDADGDYYVVDSKEALTAIANYVNDNSENNCTGKRFKQTGNITLSGTWTPIGKLESSTYYYFKGTYDGAGYNISGLRTYLDVHSGLFGVIGSGGIVKNVNVVNCFVQGGQHVGGIAGRILSGGTIDNCTVSGTILPNTSDTKKHFGGICGYSTGTIKNCTNFATIRNTGSKKSENSGGIAGYNGGSIQNCFTVGTININDNSTYIGVVVGRNSSKGTISGTYYYAGTSGYDAVGENNNTTEGSVDVTRLYTFTSISGLTIVGTHFIIGGQTYCTNVDGCYYAIADEQDLIDLAEYVRSDSHHDCEGLTFKMTRDFDFTNMPADCHDNWNKGSGNFLPIGVDKFYGDGSFFKGHFDGQGHTITGLRFNSTSPQIGLFSTIRTSETVIEGVTLVVPNFYGDGSVGGIVGALYAGTIRNCAVVNGTISGQNGRVGGIVGLCNYYSSTDVKTISGCTVIATTVNATTVNGSSEIGIIVGKNQDTSEATAAPTISGCTYHNPAGLPVCGVGNYTDGGGNQQVYQVRLSDGLTASTAAYSYGNDYYFANNATVTLGHGDRPGYDFSGYESNDVTITNGAFTMPAQDVSISAQWYDLALFGYNDDPLVDGSADHPYTIGTTDGWNLLCDALQDNDTWNHFTGKTVKLGADITVERIAGSSGHDFSGTFDGKGHKLTVNITGTGTYTAPFYYLKPQSDDASVTIRDLKVDGTINTANKYAGGLVGGCHGKVNIIDCVSDVTINSSVSDDGTHGGLVGRMASSGTLSFDGCAFTGKMLTTNGTANCGGFLGWAIGTVNINNCLYAPAAMEEGETEVGSSDSKTFARLNSTAVMNITNSYYARTLGDAQGNAASSSATLPANIGTAGTAYSVSGITPYTHGIAYDNRYYMTPEALSFVDNTANDVAAIDGYFATVTLQGRTLYKDGDWNTLCLPFNVTIANSPLAGADARALSSASLENEVLTLNFTEENGVTELVAGTPYLIKWAKANDYVDDNAHNIVNPVFSSVVINSTTHDFTSTDGKVSFKGTYSPIVWNTENKSILFVGENNTLYYPKSGAFVNACRAYFELSDDSQAREFVMNFGDEGEVNGVKEVIATLGVNDDSWYTVNGVKLSGKPTKAGLYIHNGKKVIIK